MTNFVKSSQLGPNLEFEMSVKLALVKYFACLNKHTIAASAKSISILVVSDAIAARTPKTTIHAQNAINGACKTAIDHLIAKGVA